MQFGIRIRDSAEGAAGRSYQLRIDFHTTSNGNPSNLQLDSTPLGMLLSHDYEPGQGASQLLSEPFTIDGSREYWYFNLSAQPAQSNWTAYSQVGKIELLFLPN